MRSKNFTMLQILYNEDITEANWRWRELITAVIHRNVLNGTFGINYAIRWKKKATKNAYFNALSFRVRTPVPS